MCLFVYLFIYLLIYFENSAKYSHGLGMVSPNLVLPPRPQTTLLLICFPLLLPIPYQWNGVENWRHKIWRSCVEIRIYWKQEWNRNSNNNNSSSKVYKKGGWFIYKTLMGTWRQRTMADNDNIFFIQKPQSFWTSESLIPTLSNALWYRITSLTCPQSCPLLLLQKN